MSFEIYPPDFSTRYQLTHAISIQITEHYNAIGKIQVVAPVDDYNIAALREGSVLYNTARGRPTFSSTSSMTQCRIASPSTDTRQIGY